MGNRFLVNNVSGITTLTERIELMGGPLGGTATAAGTAEKIGDAKVYGFSLRDAAYENNGTDWNLYLYDIQTYTSLIPYEVTFSIVRDTVSSPLILIFSPLLNVPAV